MIHTITKQKKCCVILNSGTTRISKMSSSKMTLETTERMNESNNTFWQKAVLSVGSVVVVAGVAIGAWIKFKDGNNV